MIAFTRRHLRRTARLTLFAWMFALLSGVANACLTQPDARAGLGSMLLQAAPLIGDAAGRVTRQVEHTDHLGADADDRRGHRRADEGCLKFCAEESSALAKRSAQLSDVTGLVFWVSQYWLSAAPVAAAAEWTPVERPASVGPPLILRLLRLTL